MDYRCRVRFVGTLQGTRRIIGVGLGSLGLSRGQWTDYRCSRVGFRFVGLFIHRFGSSNPGPTVGPSYS